jgi:hypothetical protein
MLVQVAPGNASPRNPENPIQNKVMVLRTPTTASPTLDYKWLKTSGRNHCRTLADAIVIGSNPPQYGTRNSANAAIP